jgi:2'-hydroxyisoflavone reductase
MNILIIGGTRFLGRHLVDAAMERGHKLTLFNRGRSNPTLYPQLETIQGDRENDLGQLAATRSWDSVIDTCGYVPRIVRLSAQALSGAVGQYVFISSISVYADTSKIGINESDAVGRMPDENVEEITSETYGPLKALCEEAVEHNLPGRTLIIRPGLIVGPHDPTDRFTYWPVRVARGGEVLAPENPAVPIQIIDGRDLAHFTFQLIEQKATGIFNATGPGTALNLGTMLETCRAVSANESVFRWAPVDFLAANNVQPWSDLPVWVPDSPEDAGFSRVSIEKAVSAGLTFRPLEETIQDTLTWAATRPSDTPWRAGLVSEREQQLLSLLEQWKPA